MARSRKATPLEAFEDNIADAEALLAYAAALRNQRQRRMRRELRVKVGEALGIPVAQRDDLDCIESGDLFIVLKPAGGLDREDFRDQRPLLRQAIVAGCTALETYVGDKAMEFVGPALRAKKPPADLREVPLTVGMVLDIEREYQRKGWGMRKSIEKYIRRESSYAPSHISSVLATIGFNGWANKVDAHRGVAKGTTGTQLESITKRRNVIAHSGDRRGQGRASLEPTEVEQHLKVLREVVDSLEHLLAAHKIQD